MKNQKGMTLTEIIVALAICAIFVTCAIAVISPVSKIYERTQASSDAQMIAESLLEEIRGVTAMAGGLSVSGNKVNTEDHSIWVKDGHLMIDTDPVFDEKFYEGKTVTMAAGQRAGGTVNIVLMIKGAEGMELFTIESTLKPIV